MSNKYIKVAVKKNDEKKWCKFSQDIYSYQSPIRAVTARLNKKEK